MGDGTPASMNTSPKTLAPPCAPVRTPGDAGACSPSPQRPARHPVRRYSDRRRTDRTRRDTVIVVVAALDIPAGTPARTAEIERTRCTVAARAFLCTRY